MSKLVIGISACLFGLNVAYDGSNRFASVIVEALREFAELTPICPEVEAGLPVPRERMVLKITHGLLRLLTVNFGEDYTDIILEWSRKKLNELQERNICGFIFKCGSPACGLTSVPVYHPSGKRRGSERGIFASMILDRFRDIPAEEEASLQTPHRLNNFLQKAYAYSYLSSKNRITKKS